MSETVTETFVRPNGKPYRPRSDKLRAHSWENQWGVEDRGCVITGTLDPTRAEAFAVESCAYWHDATGVADPQPGWWRLAMRDGESQWANDPERGAAGVMFTATHS